MVSNIKDLEKCLSDNDIGSRFFKFFAEKFNAVFWTMDSSHKKQLYLSPGFEKIWGRSREFLYDNPTNWLATLHPEDRNTSPRVERLKMLAETGPEARYEHRYRIYTPQGELRWIKDTSFPIMDENDNFLGFAGIAEDITKDVLHEQELQEAKLRAEVANKAKSDFLAMISHELRTPLNAILGMTQILKTKSPNPELTEYIDIISSAGTSLLSLVTDILDFARLEVGKLTFLHEPFDLPELFHTTLHSMLYLAREKNLELQLVMCEGLPKAALGDANRLRQILVNLISNAIKFTDVGQVKVLVEFQSLDGGHITLKVQVIDTGIGIKADHLTNIFEKFSQIDSIYHRKQSGIGLGLAITRQLVEAMKGHITVKSEVGIGSTFSFNLPLQLSDRKAAEEEAKAQGEKNLTFYPFKILLVEDNFINQKIAKIMLEDLGCTVDIIDNGNEVLQKSAELAHYDLIFMDIGLPDISGFEIVSQLRQDPSLKAKPIIAMTAHVLENDKKQAFEAGINRMLAKPISYSEIAAVLNEFNPCIEIPG